MCGAVDGAPDVKLLLGCATACIIFAVVIFFVGLALGWSEVRV